LRSARSTAELSDICAEAAAAHAASITNPVANLVLKRILFLGSQKYVSSTNGIA
jgi:hypothetical protein